MSEDSALQRQITDLGERMEKGFDKIEKLVTGMDARVRAVEQKEASCQPITQARLDAVWREVDEQKAKIKTLEDEIETMSKAILKLIQTNNILKWILGVLTVIGTSLLIAYLSKMAGV